MKKRSRVGLIVEGNSTDSSVLRLPHLADELGPIKSTPLRVARRLANFLRAGYGVGSYEDLQESRLILIRVSDESAARVIEEICASDLDLKNVAFALCESWLTTDLMEPLRKKGATTATLLPISSTRRRWFILEGQTHATRQVRRFIDANDGRTLEVQCGRKDLYFASELLMTAIPIPLYAAAQQALREAGISGKNLQILLEEMVQKMFRDFLNASRTRWSGPMTAYSPETVEAHMRMLRSSTPWLAQIVDEQLHFALQNLPAKIRAFERSATLK